MWQEHRNLPRAREWLTAAWQRLPAYAQAEGHLAEVEAAMQARITPPDGPGDIGRKRKGGKQL